MTTRKYWTKPELDTLVLSAERGDDWPYIQQLVSSVGEGRSLDACYSKASRLGLSRGVADRYVQAANGLASDEGPNLEIERLKRLVNFYKSANRKLTDEYSDAENLVERMREALATIEPLPFEPPQVSVEPDQEEEEAVLVFSDAQVGTKSLGQEIGMTQQHVWGPLGSYNIDVFRYRLRLWLRSVVKVVKLHRLAVPVRKCNLWFLGDILENEWIYKGQGAYIETGLLQQFYVALYEVAQAIAILASHFDEVEIRGVYGNHGRGTEKKGSTKSWVNWEFLWYRYLELVCSNISNLKFDLTLSWFDLPVVQGHKFLLLHGEDVRRYMRFPWYSTERMEKAYNELLGSIGEDFKYMIMGHHHVKAEFQNSHGEWFCNGNWVGPTQFTLKRLFEMVEPMQLMFFCHEKQGIASRWPIKMWKDDEELWQEVANTSYDVHIPKSNAEMLYEVQRAQRSLQL